MDKKVANNVIVGIFVALAFVGFIFVLFSMGGGSGLFTSQLSLYGKFSQVKGLHPGSEVSLSGLRIGVVKNISVDPKGGKDLTVEMAVGKKYGDVLKQDSVASIRTQGVLGDKYIELSVGSIGAPAVKNGDTLPSSELTDLFTKSGNLVDDISRHFDKGGKFEQLLLNLTNVSANLADITSEIKKEKGILHELAYGTSGLALNKSMAHLEAILDKINRGEGTLGSLINDPTVYEDVKAMMGGAKRSTILKYFMHQFIDAGDKAQKEDDKNKEKKK